MLMKETVNNFKYDYLIGLFVTKISIFDFMIRCY